MYIDRYEIVSYSRKWNNGKQNKKAEITNYCDNTYSSYSYHGIEGKKFLQLLSDLDDAWHGHEGKDCIVTVSFEDPKERD
tara:strand:+ start:441 stop:680 length:240 start_codon:yes stop_codon:yes gene_type:complete